MKTITLALALAAALAFPAAANATPKDGNGDGQMNKETCEAMDGEWDDSIEDYPVCIYEDGSGTYCGPEGCSWSDCLQDAECNDDASRETTTQDHRIPTPTTGGVVTPTSSTRPSVPTRQIPTSTGVMVPTTNGVMFPAATGYQVR